MSVVTEQHGSVLTVTLNRPSRHNVVDVEMMAGIGGALADAESDDSVAAIVITGAGERMFCAGLDLKAFAAGGARRPVGGPGLEVLLERTYPKPIVGAANGSAFAVGFELLLACDLIVAADHATFGIPEVKRGLVAAGGGISLLPHRIPLAIALEMGLTGEPLDAVRAHSLGLVNRVVPAERVRDEALRLAESIAANAPLAVRFTKEHMYGAVAGDESARRRMHELSQDVFASVDAKEGAQAFVERRKPVWRGQ